ncbi:MAG: hypothetical protein AB4372_01005 [Xenococcus sp. (in: cyanobacteria)]
MSNLTISDLLQNSDFCNDLTDQEMDTNSIQGQGIAGISLTAGQYSPNGENEVAGGAAILASNKPITLVANYSFNPLNISVGAFT